MASKWTDAGFSWTNIPSSVLPSLALEHLVNASYERGLHNYTWAWFKSRAPFQNYWALNAIRTIIDSFESYDFVNLIDPLDFQSWRNSASNSLYAKKALAWPAYVGINPDHTLIYKSAPETGLERINTYLIPLFETYLGQDLDAIKRFIGSEIGYPSLTKPAYPGDLLSADLFEELYLVINNCFTTRIGNNPTAINGDRLHAADISSYGAWASVRAEAVAEWTAEKDAGYTSINIGNTSRPWEAVEKVIYQAISGADQVQLSTYYVLSGFETSPVVKGKSEVLNAECVFYWSLTSSAGRPYSNLGHFDLDENEQTSTDFIETSPGIYNTESPSLSVPINDLPAKVPTVRPSENTTFDEALGYALDRNTSATVHTVLQKLNVEGAFDYY